MKRYWHKISMIEAFNIAAERGVKGPWEQKYDDEMPYGLFSRSASYWEVGGVLLNDGSILVCASNWSGPLSEVTPDIDAEPPEYAIGDVRKPKKDE